MLRRHRMIALAVVMALAGSAAAQVSHMGEPFTHQLTTAFSQPEFMRRAEFALRNAGIAEQFQFYGDSVRAITNDSVPFIGWIRYLPAFTVGDQQYPARILISVAGGPHSSEADNAHAQKLVDTLVSYLSQ